MLSTTISAVFSGASEHPWPDIFFVLSDGAHVEEALLEVFQLVVEQLEIVPDEAVLG